MKVIKRDGREKDFDINRIEQAIRCAFDDVYGDDVFSNNKYEIYEDIVAAVSSTFDTATKEVFTVEEIQDLIVSHLKRYDREVAIAYQNYREERTRQRNAKLDLVTSIQDIVGGFNKDVLTENANKKGERVCTQRDLIAGEVNKFIADTTMIPQHLLDAHNSGAIHIHDKDYFAQPLTNCELVNLKDMLENGTVINDNLIETPKSIGTAMTVVTQIVAHIASCTYGGQTISLSHIAPYVRVSKNKIEKIWRDRNLPITEAALQQCVKEDLAKEIKDAVQTFNYQTLTLMSMNGQSPFLSVAIYLNEDPEYIEETAMLAEEIFKQRIAGIKNKYGIARTQTFPKLLYFLDENNAYMNRKYFYLTNLAVQSTALRMVPDYISVKKMKEVIGHAFPPMGCRAFLSPFYDEQGNPKFYGRGNLGVCTLNLPYIALEADGSLTRFWALLDQYLEMARQVGELRYEKLRGVKAKVAPILWMHGAISRLDANDDILKAIDENGFTVTIGYSGIYEAVMALFGMSHTKDGGKALALQIMRHLKQACDNFKAFQPHLRFALYGTPQEATAGRFCEKIKERFGIIENITDKGFITNSYHVDVREEIDAFSKLDFESQFQHLTTGGSISYVETHNYSKNPFAIMTVVQHAYENIMYAEINFESDACGNCKYTGTMAIDDGLNWYCPQCGCKDQSKLSVVRRTCGYLGETEWTDGRKLDIINRVKHL